MSRELFDTNAREARLATRKRLAESTLLVVVGMVLLVVTFGSILIVLVEAPAAGANILTGNDAVWWSIVTVSTVGYGDRFPVTTVGRFIGTMIDIMVVSLFSVLTSYIATQFMARRKAVRTQRDKLLHTDMFRLFAGSARRRHDAAALHAEIAELRRLFNRADVREWTGAVTLKGAAMSEDPNRNLALDLGPRDRGVPGDQWRRLLRTWRAMCRHWPIGGWRNSAWCFIN